MLGLDFDGTRTQDDVEPVPTRWADTLNDERPDLLDRTAAELAWTEGCPLARATSTGALN